MPSVSSNDDVFLDQLYSAFNSDNNKAIDFSEFVDGLSVFMKGNAEEKLSCKISTQKNNMGFVWEIILISINISIFQII